MNSLTNKNNEDCYDHHKNNEDFYEHRRKCVDPCPPRFCECKEHDDLHPVPGSSLLEIGRGNSVLVNAANDATITAANPLLIAEVTLDPTCFCFANIKIEFSSFITLTGILAATDSITVRLSRVRFGFPGTVVKEPLETFSTTLLVLGAGNSFSIPFGFIYTEENTRLRETTYVVEVIAATVAGTGTIQFTNAQIAALAVGSTRVG